MVMMATVVDTEDGYKQTLQIATKSNQSDEKELAAPTPIRGRDNKKQKVFTVVGLKYAEARATSGEQVTLMREPENVSAS